MAVWTRYDPESGGLRKIIDDTDYAEECAALRRANGKGFLKGATGETLGRRVWSIPLEEFNALLMVGDPDASAWWADPNNKTARRRLAQRFPHWVCTEGAAY